MSSLLRPPPLWLVYYIALLPLIRSYAQTQPPTEAPGADLHLIAENVCYPSDQKDGYGSFSLPVTYTQLRALRLVHRSGSITCDKNNYAPGNFGCTGPNQAYAEIITFSNRTILVPSFTDPNVTNFWLSGVDRWESHGFYRITGRNEEYAYNIPQFTLYINPPATFLPRGTPLRLYEGEVYRDFHVNNNAGTSCVDIYAIGETVPFLPMEPEPPKDMHLIAENVCYPSDQKDGYGSFSLPQTYTRLRALRLVHRSGSVNCFNDGVNPPSNFGCTGGDQAYAEIVTFSNRSILVPSFTDPNVTVYSGYGYGSVWESHGFYRIAGRNEEYAYNNPQFTLYVNAPVTLLPRGTPLRLYEGEVYRQREVSYSNNAGTSCVDIYGIGEAVPFLPMEPEPPEDMQLIAENVCYPSDQKDGYGSFSLPNTYTQLRALRLVHRSGSVTCASGDISPANFGCSSGYQAYAEIITFSNRTILVPSFTDPNVTDFWLSGWDHWESHGFYRIKGRNEEYAYDIPQFTLYINPPATLLPRGTPLRLYEGEVYRDFHVDNNAGTSCVDIYGIGETVPFLPMESEPPKNMQLIAENVCYPSDQKDGYGSFSLPNTYTQLRALRLVHRSGSVNCAENSGIYTPANFGCTGPNQAYAEIITFSNRTILVPSFTDPNVTNFWLSGVDRWESHGFYRITGRNEEYAYDIPQFTLYINPPVALLPRGTPLRLYEGEVYRNSVYSNNAGTSCVDIYGIGETGPFLPMESEPPKNMQLIAENVCYPSDQKDGYGSFSLPNTYTRLRALRLVHRSGSVNCRSPSFTSSNFGCTGGYQSYAEIITFSNRTILAPSFTDPNVTDFSVNSDQSQWDLFGLYRIVGRNEEYAYNIPQFTLYINPAVALSPRGTPLRLYESEVYRDFWYDNNAGTSCVDIYGIGETVPFLPMEPEPPKNMQLIAENVCYPSDQKDGYGSFSLPQTYTRLRALRLVHRSGSVTCIKDVVTPANFGCSAPYQSYTEIITFSNTTILVPSFTDPNVTDFGLSGWDSHWESHAFYRITGRSEDYAPNIPQFTLYVNPPVDLLPRGTPLRLYQGEVYRQREVSYSNNAGTSCVDIYGIGEAVPFLPMESEPPKNMQLIAENVCYPSDQKDGYGSFSLPVTYTQLRALRLVHRSGSVNCAENNYAPANFGCTGPNQAYAEIITFSNRTILVPSFTDPNVTNFWLSGVDRWESLGFYRIKGRNEEYAYNIPQFTLYIDPPVDLLPRGTPLRLYEGEVYRDFWYDNNAGTSCVDIYGIGETVPFLPMEPEPPKNMQLIAENVCYPSDQKDGYGSFSLPNTYTQLRALRLVHRSGSVNCGKNVVTPANFGCTGEYQSYAEIITFFNRTILVPSFTDPNVTDFRYGSFNSLWDSHAFYRIKGRNEEYAYNVPQFTLYINPPATLLPRGTPLRLYDGEVYRDFHVTNNAGTSCVDIYGIGETVPFLPMEPEPPKDIHLMAEDVCYPSAVKDGFGAFTVPRTFKELRALRIVHREGSVSCMSGYNANFGCPELYQSYSEIVAFLNRSILVPSFSDPNISDFAEPHFPGVASVWNFYAAYRILGRDEEYRDNRTQFTLYLNPPILLPRGTALRLYEGEVYRDYSWGNNDNVTNCVDIYGIGSVYSPVEMEPEPPKNMQLIAENVCYPSDQKDGYGSFSLPVTYTRLRALRLVHRSGSVNCYTPGFSPSHFGCAGPYQAFAEWVTFSNRTILVPSFSDPNVTDFVSWYENQWDLHGFYYIIGRNEDYASNITQFTLYISPAVAFLPRGTPLRLYYSEVYKDFVFTDNAGTSCVDIYGIGETVSFLPMEPEPPREMQLIAENVCYPSDQKDAYGSFSLPVTYTQLRALRLVHRSGSVTCVSGASPANFGCSGAMQAYDELVTFSNKTILVPSFTDPNVTDFWWSIDSLWESHGFYRIKGRNEEYAYDIRQFTLYVNPPVALLARGTPFRLYYGEIYKDASYQDNAGSSCVDIYGIGETVPFLPMEPEPPREMQLIAENVCYPSDQKDRYGSFSLPVTYTQLRALRLVYRSGSVKCGEAATPANFGCSGGYQSFAEIITFSNRTILVPSFTDPNVTDFGVSQWDLHGLYRITGRNEDYASNIPQFTLYVNPPLRTEKGTPLRIYRSEVFRDFFYTNSAGTSCVDIYGIGELETPSTSSTETTSPTFSPSVSSIPSVSCSQSEDTPSESTTPSAKTSSSTRSLSLRRTTSLSSSRRTWSATSSFTHPLSISFSSSACLFNSSATALELLSREIVAMVEPSKTTDNTLSPAMITLVKCRIGSTHRPLLERSGGVLNVSIPFAHPLRRLSTEELDGIKVHGGKALKTSSEQAPFARLSFQLSIPVASRFEDGEIVIEVPGTVFFRCLSSEEVAGHSNLATGTFNYSVAIVGVPPPVPAAVRVSVLATAMTVSIASPAGIMAQIRIGVIGSFRECFFSHNEPLPFFKNILNLRLGAEDGQYYRGGLASNVAFVLICAIFLLLLACIQFTRLVGGMDQSDTRTRLDLFAEALSSLRFPGILIVPFSFLGPGIVSNSVSLIAHSAEKMDLVYGLLGLVFVLTSFLYACVIVFRRRCTAKAVARTSDSQLPSTPSCVLRTGRIVWLRVCSPRYEWAPRTDCREDENWLKRNIIIFGDFSYAEYALLDLFINLIVGILDGVRVNNDVACLSLSAVMLFLFLVSAVVLICFRPSVNFIGNGFLILVAVLTTIAGSFLVASLYLENDDLSGASEMLSLGVSALGVLKGLFDASLLCVYCATIGKERVKEAAVRILNMKFFVPSLSILAASTSHHRHAQPRSDDSDTPTDTSLEDPLLRVPTSTTTEERVYASQENFDVAPASAVHDDDAGGPESTVVPIPIDTEEESRRTSGYPMNGPLPPAEDELMEMVEKTIANRELERSIDRSGLNPMLHEYGDPHSSHSGPRKKRTVNPLAQLSSTAPSAAPGNAPHEETFSFSSSSDSSDSDTFERHASVQDRARASDVASENRAPSSSSDSGSDALERLLSSDAMAVEAPIPTENTGNDTDVERFLSALHAEEGSHDIGKDEVDLDSFF